MGRTLKRVPLDFSWPRGQVWKGYINPHYEQRIPCKACDSTGYAPEAKLFQDQWYGQAEFDPAAYGAEPLTLDHPAVRVLAERNVNSAPGFYGTGELALQQEMRRLFNHWRNQWCHHLIQADVDALVAHERLWDFTRVPRNTEQVEIVRQKIADGGNAWLPQSNGYTPTAAEVNTWSLYGMGHDGINQHVCVEARCEREGFALSCPACNGEGCTWPEGIQELYENWEAENPPKGEGFQLWETTSEGSPSSPVFSTLEALCAWCETNATTFGSFRATAAQWKKMLEEDFVVHTEGQNTFM